MEKLSIFKRVMNDELTAVEDVLKRVDDNSNDYSKIIDLIVNLKGRLIFTGVGKSGHIGEKLAATFASTGTPSFFVHATESMHGDLGMITKDDLVIDISNSGETKESLAPIVPIHRIGAKIVALTGNRHSTLAKKSDYLFEVHVDGEADKFNLAPTKSSTAVLVAGDSLAITVSELKGFSERDFGMFHPGGALGKRLLDEGAMEGEGQ
ncbi:KpsF/GutQ family sugar-phosphate isomerase [Companilactobacillus nodensis]|nr:SIS domain-containing protein [Companilactobacillus nodensis]